MNEAGNQNFRKGINFLYGDGVEKDELKALHYLKIAAEEGNTFANFEIARLALEAEFFSEISQEEAIKCAKLASDDGYFPSMTILAIHYKECMKGEDFGDVIINPDITAENIIKYLQHSAENGEASAQCMLAEEYSNGKLIEADKKLCVHWHRLAAEQGFSFSLGRAAAHCLKDNDLEKAFEFSEVGANKGDDLCQSILGMLFAYGLFPEVDLVKAKYWHELAAKQNNSLSIFALGEMHLYGIGSNKNEQKGIAYIRLAAEFGEEEAQYKLGFLYKENYFLFYDGDEVPNSVFNSFQEQAAFWLEKAANQGNADAQFHLYEHYWLYSDYKRSEYWRNKAAEQGHVKAKEHNLQFGEEDEKLEHKVIQFPKSHRTNPLTDDRDSLKKEIKAELFEEFSQHLNLASAPRNLNNIRSLIEAGETSEIEFKETFSLDTRTGKKKSDDIRFAALREICGFLNTRNGTLIIGVSDDQKIVGIEQDGFEGDKDKYSRTIAEIVALGCGAMAASLVEIEFETIEQKTLCLIKCKQSSQPAYLNFKGRPEQVFVRYGSISKEPPPSEWNRWCAAKFMTS